MLNIEKLSLKLPPAFEYRAENIVKLLSRELARIETGTDVNMERLELPAITVEPAWSDIQIAEHIANHVNNTITLPSPENSISRQTGGEG